jgi:hypothetical protein
LLSDRRFQWISQWIALFQRSLDRFAVQFVLFP